VHGLLGGRNELGGAAPSAKQEPPVDHVWIAAVARRQGLKRVRSQNEWQPEAAFVKRSSKLRFAR
jgi:hypothetical protein